MSLLKLEKRCAITFQDADEVKSEPEEVKEPTPEPPKPKPEPVKQEVKKEPKEEPKKEEPVQDEQTYDDEDTGISFLSRNYRAERVEYHSHSMFLSVGTLFRFVLFLISICRVYTFAGKACNVVLV